MTRNLAVLFDDVRDELATAFKDIIPPTDGECTAVVTLESRDIHLSLRRVD